LGKIGTATIAARLLQGLRLFLPVFLDSKSGEVLFEERTIIPHEVKSSLLQVRKQQLFIAAETS
jgi:hypothetical protein